MFTRLRIARSCCYQFEQGVSGESSSKRMACPCYPTPVARKTTWLGRYFEISEQVPGIECTGCRQCAKGG